MQATTGVGGGGSEVALHCAVLVAHRPLVHWTVAVPVYDGLHCSVAVPPWIDHLPLSTKPGFPEQVCPAGGGGGVGPNGFCACTHVATDGSHVSGWPNIPWWH